MIIIYNIFTSWLLVFKEKYKLFLLENASNLIHEFLYDNCKKRLKKFFLLKLSYKNLCFCMRC